MRDAFNHQVTLHEGNLVADSEVAIPEFDNGDDVHVLGRNPENGGAKITNRTLDATCTQWLYDIHYVLSNKKEHRVSGTSSR